MAIPENYIDKITKDGESRDICPAADKVRVGNENFDGTNLDDVLNEIAEEMDNAGDGTVTGVKVGNTTYDPDSETGVVDISPAIHDVSGKANKSEMSIVPGTGANADKTTITLKEGTSATVLTQHQDISNKANSSEVVKGINDSNGNPLPKNQDGTITLPAVQAGDKVSVIQPANPDGTFIIRVGSTDYTINLNHTHPGMAKVVVDSPANLPNPANMDADTIYGALENGDITTIYLAGHPFNSNAPETGEARIIVPTPGSTLDMGVDVGSGFSKTIQIRAKNISQALTIAISGTSGTWGINYGQLTGQSSITIPAADALLGVNIEITCTPSSDNVNEATLVISSTEITTTSLNLEAQNVSIVNLAAVKFTKQQYVETDIHPGPNTRLEIDMKFDGELVIPDKVTKDVNFIGGGSDSSYNPAKTFSANTRSTTSEPGIIIYSETTDTNCTLIIPLASFKNRSTLIINNVSHQALFNGVSGTLPTKSTTMPGKMKFGSNSSGAKPFGYADIILYSLKHYENNVLTHEYLPQSRNGVAGLYDTVTNTFISSSTAVALEAVNS